MIPGSIECNVFETAGIELLQLSMDPQKVRIFECSAGFVVVAGLDDGGGLMDMGLPWPVEIAPVPVLLQSVSGSIVLCSNWSWLIRFFSQTVLVTILVPVPRMFSASMSRSTWLAASAEPALHRTGAPKERQRQQGAARVVPSALGWIRRAPQMTPAAGASLFSVFRLQASTGAGITWLCCR